MLNGKTVYTQKKKNTSQASSAEKIFKSTFRAKTNWFHDSIFYHHRFVCFSVFKRGRFPLFYISFRKFKCSTYIEDITRWREDMNFMFERQEQYLTSERSERVRYCFCHENIKFISSSQRVMFFLLYGETISTKAKGGNRDVIERYDTHKGDIRKIRHSGPGWSGVWNLRVV